MLHSFPDHGEFLNTGISQGSAETRLNCDGNG